MPDPSETLVALEHRLTERWLAFERLDEAWPRGRTAIERAEIGRQREDVRSGAVALRDRIVTARAETLADAAVQLRRRPGDLTKLNLSSPERKVEESRQHALLASPDARGLVASVLAVVERAADAAPPIHRF